MSRKSRAGTVVDNFVMHRREMRESPAWRALSDEGRRVLFQLEIEHMRHGAAENGNLVCTYDDFQKQAGVRRASIPLAIRQCVALGFVEVTKRGRISSAMFKAPSTYRLTYLSGRKLKPAQTDDWRKVVDEQQAIEALASAAAAKSEDHVRREAVRRAAMHPPENIDRRLTGEPYPVGSRASLRASSR